MARTDPFDAFPDEYDTWFDVNHHAYESEVRAVRSLLPTSGEVIEVGVGTGRFAASLGISIGVEPSAHMRWRATARGIRTINACAEALPFDAATLDAILMVTVLCFLDDTGRAFREAYRVLRPSGCLVVGFVDRESPMGRFSEQHREASPFMRAATFSSVSKIKRHLHAAGFRQLRTVQTLFHDLDEITEVEPVIEGSGKGSFVVVRGDKPS